MQREGLFLLLILLGSALGHLTNGPKHDCIHEKLAKTIQLKVEDSPARHSSPDLGEGHHPSHLQLVDPAAPFQSQFNGSMPANVKGWHQMRIYLNFSRANDYVVQYPYQSAKYQMASRLMQNVRKYFQDSLAVNYLEKMDFGGAYIRYPGYTIPPFSLPTDLYITIWPEDNGEGGYYAAAGPQFLSSVDRRPTIGIYYLNFGPLRTTAFHSLFLFSAFAHEFTHVLGFSGNLIRYYRDPVTGVTLTNITETKNITGSSGVSETFTFIKTKEVVDYAREYYGCPTIDGMPLENDGGSGSLGSHWEKLFMPTEYMNPTVENPGLISGFTLAYLRGTGWYMTKADAAQYYDWGKGEGCKFFNICPTTRSGGYCSPQEKGQLVCSSEYYSKAVCCMNPAYFNFNCPSRIPLEQVCTIAPLPIPDGDPVEEFEEFGVGSRCILWKVKYWSGYVENVPKCHMSYCQDGQVKFKVGDKVYSCPQDIDPTLGAIKISYDRGVLTTIQCPNAADFCEELEQGCPEDCNNNGICMSNKRCMCFIGFSGPSCNTQSRILQQEEPTHFE